MSGKRCKESRSRKEFIRSGRGERRTRGSLFLPERRGFSTKPLVRRMDGCIRSQSLKRVEDREVTYEEIKATRQLYGGRLSRRNARMRIANLDAPPTWTSCVVRRLSAYPYEERACMRTEHTGEREDFSTVCFSFTPETKRPSRRAPARMAPSRVCILRNPMTTSPGESTRGDDGRSCGPYRFACLRRSGREKDAHLQPL